MSEPVANEKAARGRGPLHRVGGFIKRTFNVGIR